ncbi:uncharacterized protein BO97DRAFT_437311 [Aspergillus homomorphus CBS 101889]|uniref:Uncharacterized protein n=1 Tax=Aspergillus homomorphus (strain CBS 101889) TaxID=1450537 RepID=A0A395HLP5_ASPHC|nr:hypothetical protein BO97DRAFT_437311 [Aspergillus homomorphus CBS 101889]RAL08862.1 hypothetical protein BO97DRAFT_437311 [Aspergillus homomorphus CBS 101889]
MIALISRIIAFTTVILYHTVWHAPTYHAKFSKSKACLFIHIGTGLFENLQYWVLQAQADHNNVLPNTMDVLFCFLWSWTSFVLVRTLRRGDPRTTRPPYQAAACLRPIATLASYLFNIPSLHTASVHALDGFIYTRLAIFFFTYTPYLRGAVTYSTIYAISLPLAAALSVHNSRVPGASLVFILVMAYITQLNAWVTCRSKRLRDPQAGADVSLLERYLVRALRSLGFAELEELREVSKERALEKPLTDDYISGTHT